MRKLSLPDRTFGQLLKYILDDNITDINWSQGLWVNDLNKGRYKINGFCLDDNFIQQFYTRISNLMNVQFNMNNPLLEAETDNLRISILHDSVTNTGVSISIRKTPALRRISREKILSSEYCTEMIDIFMENAIRAHCTVVVGGLPGVGKTEYIKYLTNYIPAYERVYTIEDNLELRYAAINPEKDCVEIKISENFGYAEALKASKRQLPTWVLLAEARGKEVKYLLENISAGVHCLTTIHLDDATKIPDRLRNMGQTINENDVYSFIDLGVQLQSVVKEGEQIVRKISQVMCLSRNNEKNEKVMIYEDGKILTQNLPKDIMRKFKMAGIENPFVREKSAKGENFENSKKDNKTIL
jgi:pilus assembly protein CpaF